MQPVERLLSTVCMLATATRFVSRKRTLQTQNRYIVTVRLGSFGFMMSVAVAVFTAGLLLACGDVEANPGPLETTVTGDNTVQQSVGTEEQTSQHSDQQEGQSVFARYHSEMTQALNQAVIRLESRNPSSHHRAGEHHRRTTPECRRQNRAPSTASGRGTDATR